MRTFPQVFIDGSVIGGYDDLAAMQAAGELDPSADQPLISPPSGRSNPGGANPGRSSPPA